MSLVIPTGDDIQKLIQIENRRLEIEEFIAKILGMKPRAYFGTMYFNGQTIQGELKKMELQEGKFVDVVVTLTTRAGHPAKYQTGTEKFETSDSAVSTVVTPIPGGDGNPLGARITTIDGSNNTAYLVTFTADGDPAEDVVRDIVATLDLVATQGNAFVATITPGTPQDVQP